MIPTQPEKKKGGCVRTILIGVGGIFIVLCGLYAIGTQGGAATSTDVAPPTENIPPTVAPTSPPVPTPTPRGYVSKATWGEGWPLTVEEGFMDCLRPQQVYFLSLDRQRVWAVNAPARSQIEEKGWSDVEDIQVPGADLFPLIQEGLKLCP